MELPETFVDGFHNRTDVDFCKMTYKKLGNTKLSVSKIGLGSFQLGTVYKTDLENEAVQTVIQSIKKGINYIDVAPWYGFGNAEIVLGKALKQIPRNAYYVATKVGRYSPEYQKMFDFSAKKTIESVDESLTKLGIECIDLIQVHDLEFAPSIDIIINETLPALKKIVDQGKAKYIGITGYNLESLKEVIIRSPIKIDVVLSYARYNLFDQSLLEYIPFFKDEKLGIINAALLGMGLLTPFPIPMWHCATEEIKTACDEANKYCAKKGVSLSRLAINMSVNLPDVSTNLIGFCSVNLLEDNLNSVYKELNDIEKSVQQEIILKYFAPLKRTHWEGVEIAKYKRKLEEYAQMPKKN